MQTFVSGYFITQFSSLRKIIYFAVISRRFVAADFCTELLTTTGGRALHLYNTTDMNDRTWARTNESGRPPPASLPSVSSRLFFQTLQFVCYLSVRDEVYEN